MRKLLFIAHLLFLQTIALTVSAQIGWKWGFGSLNNTQVEAGFIAADNSGNVYGTGTTSGDSTNYGPYTIYNPGLFDQLFITKADSSGYAWVKGSQNGYCFPRGIATDDSGNVYVLAACADTMVSLDTFHIVNPAPGSLLEFLAKIDPSGNVLWVRNMTLISGDGPSLCVDHSGNAYVAGTMYDTLYIDTILLNAPGSNLCIIKLNSSGTAIAGKVFDGRGFVSAISLSQDNNLYLSGFEYSGGAITFGATVLPDTAGTINFVAKFDSLINPLWARGFSKYVTIYGVASDPTDAVYFTGYTDSASTVIGTTTIPYTGVNNIIVCKYDSSGNFSWVKWIAGDGGIGRAITTDLCGKIWIACTMAGDTMNFTDTTITFNITNWDRYLLAEYDSSGNFTTCTALPSGGDDYSSILADHNGSFYVCADYDTDSLTFGPDHLPYVMDENYFFAKYTYDTATCVVPLNTLNTKESNASLQPAIDIYPNPANVECTITGTVPFIEGDKVEIYDITGRLIDTYPLSGANTIISVSSMLPGIYECRIFNNGYGVETKKLVVIK
jgi:hypothetical protein